MLTCRADCIAETWLYFKMCLSDEYSRSKDKLQPCLRETNPCSSVTEALSACCYLSTADPFRRSGGIRMTTELGRSSFIRACCRDYIRYLLQMPNENEEPTQIHSRPTQIQLPAANQDAQTPSTRYRSEAGRATERRGRRHRPRGRRCRHGRCVCCAFQ